jgi:hypothetical protein
MRFGKKSSASTDIGNQVNPAISTRYFLSGLSSPSPENKPFKAWGNGGVPTMGFVVDVWAFKIITIFVDLIIHDWRGGLHGLLNAYGNDQLEKYFFWGTLKGLNIAILDGLTISNTTLYLLRLCK